MSVKTVCGDHLAVPTIDASTCTRCGLCARVCGGNPLTFRDGQVVMEVNPPLGCLGCGQCMAVCPTGSVTVTGRNLMPADRLPLPPRDARATPQAFDALLLARRSVRAYAKREVDHELVETILRMASSAPMGLPPSHVAVTVFHGRDKVQRLADAVATVYARKMRYLTPVTLSLLRPFMRKSTYDMFANFVLPLFSLVTRGREAGEDLLLYDAPLALLFHHSAYADPADCHIAATYAMLAAESLGLGTCLLGDITPAFDLDKSLRDTYGISREDKLGLVLIAGYAAITYHAALRRRFASVRYV